MPNINDPKSPDNSSSTIRNLFKQNEEAYRKYHEEERAEKEKAEKEKQIKLQDSMSAENNNAAVSGNNTDTPPHTSGNKKKRRKRSRNKSHTNNNGSNTNKPESNSHQEDSLPKENESELKPEIKLQNSNESKPEAKQETKPQSANERKPEVKQETKSQSPKESKTEVKQETKPQSPKESKPEVKRETKPQGAKESKPEVKRETKPQGEKESKPEVKSETKPHDTQKSKSGQKTDKRQQNKSYSKQKNNQYNNQKQKTVGDVKADSKDKQVHNAEGNVQIDDQIKSSRSEGAQRNNSRPDQEKRPHKNDNRQHNKSGNAVKSGGQGYSENRNNSKPQNKQELLSDSIPEPKPEKKADTVDEVKIYHKKTEKTDNTSETHITDIYQDVKPDEEIIGSNAKETIPPETQKSQSKIVGKFKSFFDKLVNAMKQQPEENSFEDDVDEFVLADEESAADLDAVKKNYKFLSLRPRELDELTDEEVVQTDESHIVIKTSEHSEKEPEVKENEEKPVSYTEVRSKKNKKPKQSSDTIKAQSEKSEKALDSSKTQKLSEETVSAKDDKKTDTAEEEPEISKTQKQFEESKTTESEKKSETAEEKPETSKTQKQLEESKTTESDKKPETAEEEPETSKAEEKSEESKTTERDKKIETAEEKTEDKKSQSAKDDKEPEKHEENSEAGSDEVDSEYDMSNLIYSAPDLNNNQKNKKDHTEKAEQEDEFEDIMPQRQKSERPKKELPVFDIFAEYAKENGIKQDNKPKPASRRNQSESADAEIKASVPTGSGNAPVDVAPVSDREGDYGNKKPPVRKLSAAEGERSRKREGTVPKRNLPFILNDDDFKSDKGKAEKTEKTSGNNLPFILKDESKKSDKEIAEKGSETPDNNLESETKIIKTGEENADKDKTINEVPLPVENVNKPASESEQEESAKTDETYNNPFVTESEEQPESAKTAAKAAETNDNPFVTESEEQPESAKTAAKAAETNDNPFVTESKEKTEFVKAAVEAEKASANDTANEAEEQLGIHETNTEKETSADTENNIVNEEKDTPPKKVSRFKADDLPGGDGIRILPWEPPKMQPEPVPEQPSAPPVDMKDSRDAVSGGDVYPSHDGKASIDNINDFREGKKPEVTYRYSTAVPFIVMAGKFTKTLRGEYEAIRMFRDKPPEPVRKENIDNGTNTAAVLKSPAAPVPVELPNDKKTKTKTKPKSSKKAPETPKQKPTSVLKSLSEAEPLIRHKKKKRAPEPPAEKKLSNITKLPISKIEDIDEPEEEENTNVIKLRSEKQKAAKKKKDRKKINFRYFFNSEEEYVPDDDMLTPQEQKPQIDDYNDEKDAEAIGTEIATNFQTVFARTIVLLVTTVLSIILALVGQCTSLFSDAIKNGWLWFAIFSFMIFAVSVIASRMPIMNGLMPLRRFKGNSDTAVSIASIAVAIQSVTAIFVPDTYVNGTMYIYVPLAVTALFFNSIGKLLMIIRTHNNFAYLRKPFPKYAGKIFTDVNNAEKMVSELPSHRAIIGYTKRAKFMSNFLQLSYAPDPSEELAAFVAPFTTVLSIVCGVAYGIMTQDFISGVSSFALTACMSVPMICLVAVNIPLRRLCKDALHSGAMITSYETVKQFSDTNAIMIDSSQLYPKGSVTLDGMKAFKQSKLNDAILSGAAIMNVVNGTMIHAFENIVQCSKDMLPRVDNVIYEDGKGLVGWVRGQRVLIGNRELLQAHNITPPDISVEKRYRETGSEITYISVSGELIAMFVLSYKTDRNIARELKNLEQNGVSFVVRTVDANITKEKIAERFGLYHRCITVLPTGLGNICREAMFTTDDTARAYLVTRGKLSSFAKAVAGCIKIKSNVTISKILQYVAIVLGLIIVTMISFVSGFEKLGCLEMLIYTGFWSLTSILVTMIRK